MAACPALLPRLLFSHPHTGPGPDPTLLPRCLLLALLLHVWLALLLGHRIGAPAAGVRAFGALQVLLTGPAGTGTERDATASVGGAQVRDDSAPGSAPTPRTGGRLRRQAPAADAAPGAERQGPFRVDAVDADPSRPEPSDAPEGRGNRSAVDIPAAQSSDAPAPPAPDLAPPRLDPAPTLSAPTAAAPRLERLSPPVPQPASPSLQALDSQLPLQPVITQLSDPSLPVRSSVTALPRPATTPASPALSALQSTLELPPTLRQLEPAGPAARTRPLEALRTPAAAPAPVTLAPLETQVPLPPTLRQLDTRSTPRSSERPLERLPTASASRAPAPADLAAVPSRLELPPAARMLDSPEPAPSRRSAAIERLSPLAPPSERAPVLSRLETPAPARDDEGPPPLPSSTTSSSPASPPTASPSAAAPLSRGDPDAPRRETGARAASGAPDAGVRVGHDVATAPSASASAPPPPLNLSLPRANAASVRRGPGMLELLAAPPDTKSKLEKALSEAERNDCRRAHADKGLLGALPLALDSARGKGCKW